MFQVPLNVGIENTQRIEIRHQMTTRLLGEVIVCWFSNNLEKHIRNGMAGILLETEVVRFLIKTDGRQL